jgi:glutamine amidotransferase
MLAVASGNIIPLSLFTDFQQLAVTGKSLASMGKQHQDGWGIGGYLGRWTVHFGRSEKGAMNETEHFAQAARKGLLSQSKILVAHMRKASTGILKMENSHPFIHNEWMFCHNGTIYDADRLLVPRYTYEGTTDSERFFKFLISRLDRRSVKDFPDVLRHSIEEIKKKCSYSSLTFLLSNGNYLIGYRDCCEDEDYYTLHYSFADNLSFIFCSEQLPGHDWETMQNGELVVVDKCGGFVNEF